MFRKGKILTDKVSQFTGLDMMLFNMLVCISGKDLNQKTIELIQILI